MTVDTAAAAGNSSITGCYIAPRQNGDAVLFAFPSGIHEGYVEVTLNRYAIVPIEEYNDLRCKAGLEPVGW